MISYIRISFVLLIFIFGTFGLLYLYNNNTSVEEEIPIIMPNIAIDNFKELPVQEYDKKIPHLDKTFYKELDNNKDKSENILSKPESPMPQISQERLYNDVDSALEDFTNEDNTINKKIPTESPSVLYSTQTPMKKNSSVHIHTKTKHTFNKNIRYSLQLGSLPTEIIAQQELKRLKNKYHDLINTVIKVVKIDLGKPKGVRYRISAGSFTKKHALKKCNNIKKLGGACLVVNY